LSSIGQLRGGKLITTLSLLPAVRTVKRPEQNVVEAGVLN
jgi:hypothetical protein